MNKFRRATVSLVSSLIVLTQYALDEQIQIKRNMQKLTTAVYSSCQTMVQHSPDNMDKLEALTEDLKEFQKTHVLSHKLQRKIKHLETCLTEKTHFLLSLLDKEEEMLPINTNQNLEIKLEKPKSLPSLEISESTESPAHDTRKNRGAWQMPYSSDSLDQLTPKSPAQPTLKTEIFTPSKQSSQASESTNFAAKTLYLLKKLIIFPLNVMGYGKTTNYDK